MHFQSWMGIFAVLVATGEGGVCADVAHITTHLFLFI